MSEWSPPMVPQPWLLATLVLFVLWLLYALFVLQQILLGVFPIFLFAGLYLGWRFLAAFEAIADAQQHIAAYYERDEE